jgi:hypothetical protein
MRAVEKEKEITELVSIFSYTPVDHPRDPPITSLFCQVGQQFTHPDDALSRLKQGK